MFRFESRKKNENGPTIELPPLMDISQVGEFLYENAPDEGSFHIDFNDIIITFEAKGNAEEMQLHISSQFNSQMYDQKFKSFPVLEQSIILERQPQVDELVEQIDTLDFGDDKEVLHWLLKMLQTGTKFRIDAIKIENRFKEQGIMAKGGGFGDHMETKDLVASSLGLLLNGDSGLNRDAAISSINSKLTELG